MFKDLYKSKKKPLLIAHRGLHDSTHKIYENTLSSFSRALKENFPIELDVHLTLDEKVVVFHDDTLDRLTKMKGKISNFSLEELRKIKITDSEDTIPSLEEVLELIKGKIPIFIEIKSSNKSVFLAEKVYELIKEKEGEYIIQSFDPYPLIWFEKNAPSFPRGMLLGTFSDYSCPLVKKIILRFLLFFWKVRPSYLAVDYSLINDPFVIFFTKYYFKPLIIWTVKKTKIKEVPSYIDGIIFDP